MSTGSISTRKTGMLMTSTLSNLMKTAVELCDILAIAPLKWDSAQKRPLDETSGSRLFVWRVNTGMLLLYYGYVGGRFLFLSLQGLSVTHTILVFMMSAFYGISLALKVESVMNREEWVGHVWKTMDFYDLVERKYFPEATATPSEIKLGERLGYLIFGAGCANWIVFSTLGIWYSNSPGGLTPIVGAVLRVSGVWSGCGNTEGLWANTLLNVPLQLFLHVNIVVTGIKFVLTFLGDLLILNIALAQVKKEQVAQRAEADGWTKLMTMYQLMTIVMNGLVGMYGSLVLALQFGIMALTVFSCYSAVRVSGPIGSLGGLPSINIFGIFLFMYNQVANFNKDSATVLQEWKAHVRRMGIGNSKRLESLRPLRFTVGSTYFIDKMAILTLCKIVFDASVNALLMTKIYRE